MYQEATDEQWDQMTDDERIIEATVWRANYAVNHYLKKGIEKATDKQRKFILGLHEAGESQASMASYLTAKHGIDIFQIWAMP